MIELPRSPFNLVYPRVKVLGIGNAGSNALDQIVRDGASGMELVAVNTDVQVLTSSIAPYKLQIGQTITRGLGAGGDPDLGRTAAEEAANDIAGTLGDGNLVFLVVGLGGGTGSGAAPVIAETARQRGAMVVVIATIPFAFEGKRRLAQAEVSLAALRETADVVLCFENDKMGEAVAPNAPIQEAFAIADRTISESVRSLAAFAGRKGLVHTSFDEVVTAFRGNHVRCMFGCGAGTGENRAHEALETAFRNPLLNRTALKSEADNVVVSICGGPDLMLNEVQTLMGEFQRHVSDCTRVFFGATIDEALAGKLTVSILGSFAVAPPVTATTQVFPSARIQRPAPPAPVPVPEPEVEIPQVEEENVYAEQETAAYEEEGAVNDPVAEQQAELLYEHEAAPQPPVRPVVTTVRSTVPPARAPLPARVPRPARDPRAEQAQQESASRGRFEKSEPTIIDGQDLDVPTFLRRNLKVR